MGHKKDLSDTERSKVVRLLGKGHTYLEIARKLGRDRRTIEKFVLKGGAGRKKRHQAPLRKLTPRDVTSVKLEMARKPLSSSAEIFEAAGLDDVPKSTRCRILRGIGKVKKVKTRPPINKKHKEQRLEWSRKYMKTDFSKVLWTDEMRGTLDGPDGWARGWVQRGTEAPVRIRRQQGGGGVMIWAGIINSELVGPFRVKDGVKMNSEAYCNFLEENLVPWLRRKSAAFRKSFIFMHDNAPSHSSRLESKGISGERLMEWPACSPDLNCIENFWSALKRKLYANGKQYKSKESLWQALQKAAATFKSNDIAKLTKSMDNRLLSVIQKKGSYIGY
jgi:transposase